MEKRISHKEWLSIFPEAQSYLESDLWLQYERLNLLQQIYSNQLDIVGMKMKNERRYEIAETYLNPEQLKWIKRLDTELNEEPKEFWTDIVDYFVGGEIVSCEKRIKEIKRYIDEPQEFKGSITQQDIEIAKEYSFDNLIDFKHGKTLCPFHNEKTPSFNWNKKNNTVKCFGCGWYGDTIKYVMETESVGFIQAVKMLK